MRTRKNKGIVIKQNPKTGEWLRKLGGRILSRHASREDAEATNAANVARADP